MSEHPPTVPGVALSPPEALALVNAAMRALGAENAPQLADQIGMTGRNQAGTVRKWMKREAAPSFEPTIQLLRVVGALDEQRWAQVIASARAEPGEAASQNEGEALPQLVRRQPGAGQVEEAMLTVLAELRALLPELRALTEAQEQPREAARQEGTLS